MVMKNTLKRNLRAQVFLLFLMGLLTVVLIGSIMQRNNTINDATNTDLLPQTGSVQLTKDVPALIEPLGITATLRQTDVAFPECRDCLEYAKVELTAATGSATLEYKLGGFAGYLIDTQTAFEYDFVLKELKQDQVTLEYTRK